jgi:hypothetical protein
MTDPLGRLLALLLTIAGSLGLGSLVGRWLHRNRREQEYLAATERPSGLMRDRDVPFDRSQFNRSARGDHELTCPAHQQWKGLEDRTCRCAVIRERRARLGAV